MRRLKCINVKFLNVICRNVECLNVKCQFFQIKDTFFLTTNLTAGDNNLAHFTFSLTYYWYYSVCVSELPKLLEQITHVIGENGVEEISDIQNLRNSWKQGREVFNDWSLFTINSIYVQIKTLLLLYNCTSDCRFSWASVDLQADTVKKPRNQGRISSFRLVWEFRIIW